MVAISVNNIFHIRGAAANSTFIAAGPPGFTALSLLELGSYGRKMCANNLFFIFLSDPEVDYPYTHPFPKKARTSSTMPVYQ